MSPNPSPSASGKTVFDEHVGSCALLLQAAVTSTRISHCMLDLAREAECRDQRGYSARALRSTSPASATAAKAFTVANTTSRYTGSWAVIALMP